MNLDVQAGAACTPNRPRKRSAISAPSSERMHEITNGACTPKEPITAPPSAEPPAMPPTSADEVQLNASFSVPDSTTWLTSEYWQENVGAMANPARKLHTAPAATELAATSGAAHAHAPSSSAK